MGLVDFVASDAHDVRTRPPQLSPAYREVVSLFGEETALRIFVRNQEKILEAVDAKTLSVLLPGRHGDSAGRPWCANHTEN